MNHKSLYHVLGVADFSAPDVIRLRIAELTLNHGDDFSRNLPTSVAEKIRLANHILSNPESKQRYDLIWHAFVGNQPTLPRFGNTQEAEQVKALARLLEIVLAEVGPQTYRVVESNNSLEAVEDSDTGFTVEIGTQKIEFMAVRFGVDQAFSFGQPELHLHTEPPKILACSFAPEFLSPADEGTLIFVQCSRVGRGALVAACANHSTRKAIYVEDAADNLFSGSLSELAQDFGVRAKLARVQELTIEFHRELSRFAQATSEDFNSLSEDRLIQYVRQQSFLF